MSLGYGDDGFGVGDSPRPGERAEDRPPYAPKPMRGEVHWSGWACETRRRASGSTFATSFLPDINCPECCEAVAISGAARKGKKS